MQPFRGRFRLSETGAARSQQEQECTIELNDDGLTVTPPAGAALPVAFAEISTWEAQDYVIGFDLAEGRQLEIFYLAKRYEELCSAFREMRRDHFLKALLFEERGDGAIEAGVVRRCGVQGEVELEGPGHVRLQRTSVVVIPDQARPFLVPYGEVESIDFDPEAYVLRLGQGVYGTLELARFGKRTDALRRGLQERVDALSARTARTLALVAPDLSPSVLRQVGGVMRDGVAASREELERAAPGFWAALWQVGFLPARRPFVEALAVRADAQLVAIKETAPETEESAPTEEHAPATKADVEDLKAEPEIPTLWTTRQLLYFFVVGNAVVLEVPTQEDSATYVYASGGKPERRVRELCRSLSMVQFRREPVFLDEAALNSPKGLRYREAMRTLEDLRQVRAAFAGRAIHSSLAAWERDLSTACAACAAISLAR